MRRLIRVALANINTTVGAFRSNTDKVIAAAKAAVQREDDVVVYPESVICGYGCEDLLDWRGFTEGQWEQLLRFARSTADDAYPTIHLVGLFVRHDGDIYNAVAVVRKGQIYGGVFKENLPAYGVFYESRKCSRGRQGMVLNINGYQFGDVIFKAPFGLFSVDICEDIWNAAGPLMRHAYQGSEVNFTVNASPFRFSVHETRYEMLATRSSDNFVAEIYCNLFGANDGLTFDSGGYIFVNGRLIAEGARWEKGFVSQVIDLDAISTSRTMNTTWKINRSDFLQENPPVLVIEIPDDGPKINPNHHLDAPFSSSLFGPQANSKHIDPREEYLKDMLEALVLGTLDYYRKTRAFRVIGNAGSGGVDSAITTIIKWLVAQHLLADQDLTVSEQKKRLSEGFFTVFSMPTKFNSERTKSNIEKLCAELGILFKEQSIQEAYEREVEALKDMLPPGQEPDDITLQNIQARIRFTRMWNWSNATGGFFSQNGNMSEKAVGYGTIGGGDMDGGVLAIIANLPKTIAIEFLRYLGRKFDLPSAIAIADTPPSAELKENQQDETDLMPYSVLDACFSLFAGEKLMPLEIYQRVRQMFTDEHLLQLRPSYKPGMLKAWVKRFLGMFMRSIFKWVRTPLSIHLGNLDLDRERALQMPVVQSMEWLEDSLAAIDQQPD